MAVEVLAIAPAILLLALANYTEKRKELRILTKIFLGLIVLFVIIAGGLIAGSSSTGTAQGVMNQEAYGGGLVLTGLVALVLFLKPIRAGLSRLISIDPDNWLHATALVFAILLVGMSIATATTTDVIKFSKGSGSDAAGVVLQDALFVISALIGVGWLVRRNWKDTVNRLGLRKPIVRDVMMSLVYLLIIFAIVIVLNLLAEALNVDSGLTDNEDPTVQILGGVTILTAIVFALGAGIGEEILFRGAMQPRFGIILVSLIFMSLHVQYANPVQLGTLFGISVVFGYERKTVSTTSAIITHTLYDMILLLAVALQ